MYVYGACFMSVVVTVWGYVVLFIVYRALLIIVLSLGVVKYFSCFCGGVMDVLFSVLCASYGSPQCCIHLTSYMFISFIL